MKKHILIFGSLILLAIGIRIFTINKQDKEAQEAEAAAKEQRKKDSLYNELQKIEEGHKHYQDSLNAVEY